MNVRIFGVCAKECMCAQTRPWFILLSERVIGNGVRTHVNSKGKIPSTGGSEKGRTCDAVSHRTASPTHYRLSYSGHSHRVIDAFVSTSIYRYMYVNELHIGNYLTKG